MPGPRPPARPAVGGSGANGSEGLTKLVIPAPGYPPGAPIDAGTGGRGTAPTCSTGGVAAATAAAARAGAAVIGANIPTGADEPTGATGGCTAANGRIAPIAEACTASPTTACGAAAAGEITSLAARSIPRNDAPAESTPACCATASAAAAGAAGEAPETAGDGGGAIAAAAARNAVP
jgi:hypothetical protein